MLLKFVDNGGIEEEGIMRLIRCGTMYISKRSRPKTNYILSGHSPLMSLANPPPPQGLDGHMSKIVIFFLVFTNIFFLRKTPRLFFPFKKNYILHSLADKKTLVGPNNLLLITSKSCAIKIKLFSTFFGQNLHLYISLRGFIK